ncbi:MAG: hypothetical protein FWE89_04255 [Syntrophaceae bacterium]|nr:hypothetical protein [Syntrophaceae bacterium]
MINRKTQKLILDTLYMSLPDHAPFGTFGKWQTIIESGDELIANMLYLEEHGVIKSGIRRTVDGHFLRDEAGLRITAKGIDFLMEDGGLGAILNTVTVKIHDDSMERLEQFISRASLNPQDKTGLLSQLRGLPADSIKHLCLKLLDLGLENAPAALRLIQTTLASGGLP